MNEKALHEQQVKFDLEKNALNTRIKELNHKYEDANKEIIILKQSQYMSNNNGFNLEDVLEDPDELQKQIDEKDKKIFQMKQEQKYYEKTINELKNTIAKNKSDTNEKEALQAENKCLSANIEAVKKQLDAIKAQKDKDEKEFKEEIKSQMDSAASAKCQLGMISFEKEQEIIKYKRYIKKLQAKLIGVGVVFGKRKHRSNFYQCNYNYKLFFSQITFILYNQLFNRNGTMNTSANSIITTVRTRTEKIFH